MNLDDLQKICAARSTGPLVLHDDRPQELCLEVRDRLYAIDFPSATEQDENFSVMADVVFFRAAWSYMLELIAIARAAESFSTASASCYCDNDEIPHVVAARLKLSAAFKALEGVKL